MYEWMQNSVYCLHVYVCMDAEFCILFTCICMYGCRILYIVYMYMYVWMQNFVYCLHVCYMMYHTSPYTCTGAHAAVLYACALCRPSQVHALSLAFSAQVD